MRKRTPITRKNFNIGSDINPRKKKRQKRRNIQRSQLKKRLAKVKRLLPSEYMAYISSRYWKRKRIQYFTERGNVCVACRSGRDVIIHHMTYKRLGKEELDDLVALCWGCHYEYHDTYGTQEDMIETTSQFIIEKQEMIEFKEILERSL